MKRIAIEEHILQEEFSQVEERLKDMSEAGIDMQVLSFGLSIDREDNKVPESLIKNYNDGLAELVGKYPTKFAALAALAVQAPEAAASELERAVKELGFKGALIFSDQGGDYLDKPNYWPMFAMAASLEVPIYLHPGKLLPDMEEPYWTYPVLSHAMWGYAAGTGLQAMRLICSGIFDKYPKLKIILGHMGEGIPYYLWRIDNHWEKGRDAGVPGFEWVINCGLRKTPGEYFRDNFYVTTSGMFWHPALQLAHSALGADRILFAVDYPHESAVEASKFIESAPMSASDREKISYRNAEKLLRL